METNAEPLDRLAHRASASGAESAAAQSVPGFFETVGAQHHRDEDEDLFPLLIAAQRHARFEAGEAGRFAWLYRRHMDRETQLVLPFAREALDTRERAELGARMAARRSTK